MAENQPKGFAVPGVKPNIRYDESVFQRRKPKPKPDNKYKDLADTSRVDYANSMVNPQNWDKNKIAEEVQYKHQQYRKSRNKTKVKSDFDVEIGFGSRGRGMNGGGSMLRNAGKHSQRTIFFDNTGSESVSMERRPVHMFPDPYQNPSIEEPKVFMKSFEFNLFKYIEEMEFDNAIMFERENLFKRMLQDIRRIFASPQYQNLTTEKLYRYFQAVSQAVIEYYEIDSLMANDAFKYNDTNRGVRLLLNQASNETQLLETQFKLRRAIQGSYLPTKVFEFLRWISQYYTFNEQGDSRAAAFKFSLGLGMKSYALTETTDIIREPAFSSVHYVERVDKLINDLYIQQEEPGVQAAIAKTYPEWAILDLPLSCNRPIYDQRAVDLWLNTPAIMKTNTTFYVRPDAELGLELATMGEANLDQVVPACTTVTAITNNRTDTQLDAVLSPTFSVAIYNTSDSSWSYDFSYVKNWGPQAQSPITNVVALQLNSNNRVEWGWLNNLSSQALPDTWKVFYENGGKTSTQFNTEVLRLKPLTESQKAIEVCEFITRLITG